ncbi:MAG TPA: FG-GAP-like repeat-containing protein, partial [Chthonomonadaceae bacterium]|nr:FG-GAP-like repeat-containing protein [Chthonomonadaceae bacterium]
GGPNSQTYAINGNGDGAGQAQTPAGSWHAFLFTSGMVDLGTLGGAWSGATAVNDALQVAGWSYTASGPTRAFLWQGGSMTDLGTLGGPQSGANGINESGQVVGWADIELQLGGKYIYHAFLYSSANGMQDLGTINGFPYSDADAVNTAGVVVGYVSTGRFVGTRHAFVWDPVNGMQDLNSLIPAGTGWLLQEATGINARGQICGYGTLGGQVHAFVLSPPGASASPINFDINGDGHTDLLWQNQNDGGVYYWLMDNTTILGGNYLSPPNLVSPEWQIVGTPDLNGDGHPDLLWQNQVDGAVYYWLMDGPQVTSGGLLVPANTIDLNWKIVGTPDLNGDGSPDILWQNQANGGVYYWLMNGVQVVSGSFLVPPGQVDPSWQIVSTPDLNGDGSADLLWENSADGAVFYTLLNGIQLVSGGFLAAPNTIDPSWHIAATLDINGDGYTDILWENSVDAGVYYWLMNGTGYLSGDYLVAPYVINPSAGWRIVAPH